MEFFNKIVHYFDAHPGYELLMAFMSLVLSTLPYLYRFFTKRFHLKAAPIAYRYFSYGSYDTNFKINLAIQVVVTNLSEVPCTITQIFLIVGKQEKYVSAASENIFSIESFGKKTGEYFSLPLPQNLPPHQGINGCLIIPNFNIKINELKNSKCALKLICGNKIKFIPINFSTLHTPLYL